ncbi:hypothetical protein QFZ22_000127 [Streptomyces canus]|uniref:Uncharacterized protein n=1 Tax=Streptomyces canus TaxID=58343 RepID=A0AAW8F238_9ACTN|nr:hypothetical protein [Streptomyces canus]MDQ0904142.1 hypothetical protein [Streptomyces canus]
MPKKQPGPVFTIQPATPAKPGWWQAHRHQVLATVALIVGFLLGQNNTNAPAATNTPPAHTAPADSTSPSTP